ncbi:hypothetical protein [Cryptosporangium aurantiacum]|nr:hypothetical protein [Cryptosporangium aurantiacum]
MGLALVCGWPHWQVHSLAATMTLLECGTTAAAGVLLATGRGTRPTGMLLLVTAACWALTWLASWNAGPGPLIAVFAQSLFFFSGSLGILYYPDGRLHGRAERWWMVVAAASLFGGQVLLCLVTPPSLYGFADDVVWPRVWRSDRVENAVLVGVTAATVVAAAGLAAVIWRRQRRLRGLERALTLPVLATVAVVGLLSAFVQTGAITGLDSQLDTYLLQGSLGLAVPLALLAVGLRRCWIEVSTADQAPLSARSPMARLRVQERARPATPMPTGNSRIAGELAGFAARLLPPSERSWYAEEYQSELHILAEEGASRREQVLHVVRVLVRALPLYLEVTGRAVRWAGAVANLRIDRTLSWLVATELRVCKVVLTAAGVMAAFAFGAGGLRSLLERGELIATLLATFGAGGVWLHKALKRAKAEKFKQPPEGQ